MTRYEISLSGRKCWGGDAALAAELHIISKLGLPVTEARRSDDQCITEIQSIRSLPTRTTSAMTRDGSPLRWPILLLLRLLSLR